MKRTRWLLGLPVVMGLTACTEIDCPLENTVMLTMGFYGTDGVAANLPDTLSVLAAGTDSVLFNRGIGIDAMEIPMSYAQDADTLLLQFTDDQGRTATDSVIVNHTNNVHFENMDCPPAVFHVITSVRWTSHETSALPATVDSVAIEAPNVNYDAKENLKVYFRTR